LEKITTQLLKSKTRYVVKHVTRMTTTPLQINGYTSAMLATLCYVKAAGKPNCHIARINK